MNVTISQLVRGNLPVLVAWLEKRPEEVERLTDAGYCKATFKLGFPFLRHADDITGSATKRWWKDPVEVDGQVFRVSSQWFKRSVEPFLAYVESRGVMSREEALANAAITTPALTGTGAGRYGGYAIGIAQNAFIRHLLGNIGDERFRETDWLASVEWFGGTCAYCGVAGKLVMDHGVPISRTRLGEHRLGNLVPSCHSCNERKGESDFREFLGDDHERIDRILAFQEAKEYVPLDNPEVAAILAEAHAAVRTLAERYVEQIEAVAGEPRVR